MNKAFEKILEFIDEQIKIEESIAKSENEGHPITHQYGANCMNVIKKFVQEVAEEYKGDMKHNLAEMYAKNMVDYGVDVTKAWQTAIQQSYALEKAYISGRQYEVDRFNELRKEYSNGWISCSVRLPEPKTKSFGNKQKRTNVLVTLRNGVVKEMTYEFATKEFWEAGDENYIEHWKEDYNGNDVEVIAWMPLPEPYQPKGE